VGLGGGWGGGGGGGGRGRGGWGAGWAEVRVGGGGGRGAGGWVCWRGGGGGGEVGAVGGAVERCGVDGEMGAGPVLDQPPTSRLVWQLRSSNDPLAPMVSGPTCPSGTS